MKRLFPWMLALLIATPLLATTVVSVPVGESVRLSGLIVKGEVLNLYAGLDAEGQIVTNVTVAVSETLKGDAPVGGTVTFQAWGGSLGGFNVETVGEAKYSVGEKVLVQLEDIDGTWHTLGLAFGKWNVQTDRDGEEILRRDLSELCLVLSDSAPVNEISMHEFKRLAKAVQVGR